MCNFDKNNSMVTISKNKAFLILLIAFVLSVVICVILARKLVSANNKGQLWQDNYLSLIDSTKIIKSSFGVYVTTVKNYEFRISDLEKKNYSKDSLIGKYLRIIKSQDKELKRMSSIITATVETHGGGSVVIVHDTNQSCQYGNINDGYLDVNLQIWPDTINYLYTYKDEIYIATGLIRKPNNKGNQYPWIVRFIRPWVEGKTTLSAKNPNSLITCADKIKFTRK